ncbi:MAG: DegV family protein [Kosmotoga sp.]|nr:MAG: DegV family protein [Kosmotoga sp.]
MDRKVKILIDSTSDVPADWLKMRDLELVPLHINWANGVTEDDNERNEESLKKYWQKLVSSEELPKSSQPSPAMFLEKYKEAIDDGYDEIVVFCLSTAMSGTFNSAFMVTKEVDIPVHVVNTRMASAVIPLIARRFKELINNGKSTENAIKEIEKEIDTGKYKAIFYVSNFDFLIKGGRVSKFQGFVGNLLNINVGLYINEKTGEMVPFKKVRGEKKAQKSLINKTLESVPKGSTVDIMLVHADNKDGIEKLKEYLTNNYNIEFIEETFMGKVISTHVGPGTAGFALYWRK